MLNDRLVFISHLYLSSKHAKLRHQESCGGILVPSFTSCVIFVSYLIFLSLYCYAFFERGSGGKEDFNSYLPGFCKVTKENIHETLGIGQHFLNTYYVPGTELVIFSKVNYLI